jgi:peroxiredoxin Q/BCP
LEEKMPDLKVGDPAPNFTLKDSNGQTVRLADLRGKKIMLYFFTSPGGGN